MKDAYSIPDIIVLGIIFAGVLTTILDYLVRLFAWAWRLCTGEHITGPGERPSIDEITRRGR